MPIITCICPNEYEWQSGQFFRCNQNKSNKFKKETQSLYQFSVFLAKKLSILKVISNKNNQKTKKNSCLFSISEFGTQATEYKQLNYQQLLFTN